MNHATSHWWTLLAGLLLVLLGAIWMLQGIGLLRGSVMTGQSMWLVIGAIVALAGLGLIAWSLATRRRQA